MPGVDSFRLVLQRYIRRENVCVRRLAGKYIPNLTARPFEVSRSYFEEVGRLTGSQVVGRVVSEVCVLFLLVGGGGVCFVGGFGLMRLWTVA